MRRTTATYNLLILLAMLCSFATAEGQRSVTKSGTHILPAPRAKAQLGICTPDSPPSSDPSAGTYLVVTRPDLLAPLQPLLQWKREQGFRVETLVMNTNKRDSVRQALLRRYSQSSALRPPQRYVLIVGDIDRIQGCFGQHTPAGLNSHNTDLYYGEYTGDYLPEAFVGRLSVSDSAELSIVVRKIIDYEQGRWAMSQRALFVAGREDRSPAPLTTNGQVDFLAELFADALDNIDTICYRNPQSDSLLPQLLSDLDRSNLLVNYTAHCTTQGWNNPTVNGAAIDSLANDSPTVWVNNCCLSNAFSTNCFGEELLRNPQGGAAGVIGATNETLWMEDYYWAVGARYPSDTQPPLPHPVSGAFQTALQGNADETFMTLGGMNYNGCKTVTLAASPYDAFYWEIYNVLGDPSMIPFFGDANTLEIDTPDTIVAGTTEILVQGNSPRMRVVATLDTTTLGITNTYADGAALMPLGVAPAESHITITATAPGAIFAQKEVVVIPCPEGRLVLKGATIDSNLLHLSIVNIGQQTAAGHTVTLWQDADDLRFGAVLAQQFTAAIGTLGAGTDTTLTFDIEGYTIGTLALLQGHITFADAENNRRNQAFALDLDEEIIQLERVRIFTPGGTAVKKIYGGKDYLIATQYSVQPDSMRLAINGESLSTTTLDGHTYFQYHTPEEVGHLLLNMEAHRSNHTRQFAYWLLPYQAVEDFERGDLTLFPWQLPNISPWVIDSTLAHEGRYSLRSNPGQHHATRSVITLRITTLEDDSVSFFHRVSSEPHDLLEFYIDGRRRGYWSGNQDWQQFRYPLPAGEHELVWYYLKDASGSELNDCAHIDDIRLPLALWNDAYGQVRQEEAPAVGIQELGNTTFAISPNPCRESVRIQLDAKPYDRAIAVYDAQGRKVDEIKIAQNATSAQYSTQHLRLGIFMLVLHDKQHRLVKVIKN